MTITIPTWLLWTIGLLVGVPAAVAVIAFAWLGYVVAKSLSKGGLWR
ncbi:MAG: hypothetical protein ACK4Z8_04995 [Novosphingobium sp.]